MWSRVDWLSARFRFVEAASLQALANAAEELELWGPGPTVDEQRQIARDLYRWSIGGDVELTVELYRWIDARVASNRDAINIATRERLAVWEAEDRLWRRYRGRRFARLRFRLASGVGQRRRERHGRQ